MPHACLGVDVGAVNDAFKAIHLQRMKEKRAPHKETQRKGWGRAKLTLQRMKVRDCC
jgi:hypothetical protein